MADASGICDKAQEAAEEVNKVEDGVGLQEIPSPTAQLLNAPSSPVLQVVLPKEVDVVLDGEVASGDAGKIDAPSAGT